MPLLNAPARLVAALAVLTFGPALAHAACSNPTGDEGTQVYNSTFKVMQFCNGTDWISMAGTNASGAWAPSGTALYFNGGNVGIGTDTPSKSLEVNTVHTSNIDDDIRIGSYYLGNFYGLKINYMINGLGTPSAHIRFQYGGSALGKISFNENGNIGIGNEAPGYALQVAGAVAGSSAYVNTSDARLKKNVQDISYGLATLDKLQPVTFEWKEQKEDWQHGRKLGLIAQEVEKVIPEVVSTAKDPSGTKSLAYGDLVPVLIHAVQELKAANDAQQAEINALKKALGQ